MTKKQIKTVGELLEKLKAYPLDTEVSHLTRNGNNKIIGDLYITETHPIGSRDTEELLLLAFSDSPRLILKKPPNLIALPKRP